MGTPVTKKSCFDQYKCNNFLVLLTIRWLHLAFTKENNYYTYMQDKDGRISLQDFLDGAKADSTIVRALTIYDGLL